MTTPTPQTPPPLPDAGDSRLDSFLLKAAPIIAAERGINAKSRIMLEALARDSKLPDELFDQAIHMLQGAPPVAKKSRNRWYKAYSKYLKQQLKDVPRGIITAKIEARAIQKGTSKFQLSEDQAREALHEVSAELGIRRISQSEAERHVATIIQQKVGDVEWLDEATIKILHESGRKWGLSKDQVDAVIHRLLDENRRRQEKENRTAVIAITSACVLIVVILTGLVGLMLFRKPVETIVAEENVVPAPERNAAVTDRPVTKKSFDPPKWWSETLTMASVKARINEASFAPIYEKLVANDPNSRGEAYQMLNEFCREELKTSRAMSHLMLDQIYAESHALEPNDAAAEQSRESLLELVAGDLETLPEDADVYERGFWAVRVAARQLARNDLPGPRADKLELALGRAIGTAVRRGGDRDKLEQRCLTALAESYYGQLTENARAKPSLTSDLHQELTRLVAQFARDDPDLLNRLDSAYLGELLKADGGVWARYQENGLIEICLSSSDPVNVLRFVEALEETTDRTLQLYLAEMFIRTLGAIPKSADPADVAQAVRETLGITSRSTAKTAHDRWKILRESVEEFQQERKKNLTLAARSPGTWNVHRRRLFNTVDLSHLATLACALAQQETGVPEFDKLDEAGPPDFFDEERDKEAAPATWRGPPLGGLSIIKRDRDDLKKRIRDLSEVDKKLQPIFRASVYKGLVQRTRRIPQILPREGRVIATYMLLPKEESEQESVLDKAKEIARWKQVRLALADLIRQSSVKKETVQDLLSEILDGEIRLDGQDWRLEAAHRLLRSVLDDLSTQTVVVGSQTPDMIYDAAALALHTRYKSRARLLGISAADYESTDSPAELLRVLVDQTSASVRGRATATSDKSFLQDLPHRLRAIHYLGNNDLRATVLLQRLWMQLVAIQLKNQRTDRTSNANQVIDDLRERDARSTDLLAQLEDGEAATLEMWMLFGP